MKMGRSLNKDSEASAVSLPERRSLRHSKPAEDDIKTKSTVKGRKSFGKKKEEKVMKKSDERVEKKTDEESGEDEKNQTTSDADGETSSTKPTARRSGRKRQLSEEADPDDDDTEKEDEKNDDPKADGSKDENLDETMDENMDENIDENMDEKKSENKDENNEENKDKNKGDKEEKNEAKGTSKLKNGQEGGSSKSKAKKKRKPPTKKKKEVQDESEMWTPLEPLDGDERKETQKKTQGKSDRRKQALIERQAPAEPMLQKQLPRQRRNSDTSECEVLASVPRTHRRSKTIVTVDIDDEASETGSIQIVAEPDVSYVFDFKRLLIQYRNVNLPSSLWGAHKDPRNNFISFTRFNPDYPDINGLMVDRAVVFRGSLNHEVFVNGEKTEPPAMFNAAAETLLEIAQIIQFVNNTISPPISQQSNEPSDVTCSG